MMGFGELLPDGGGMKLPWRQRLGWLLVVLVLIGLIVLYVFEFWWMDNTIGVEALVLYSLVAGALAGAALGWWLGRRVEDYYDRFRIVVISSFLAAVFAPLLGSLSNRLLGGPVEWRELEVVRVEQYAQSRLGFMKGEQVQPDGYYLFAFHGRGLERFRFRRLPEPLPRRGQKIRVPVRQGFWGFEVVLPLDSHTTNQTSG